MRCVIDISEEHIELLENLTDLAIGQGDNCDFDELEYAIRIVLDSF